MPHGMPPSLQPCSTSAPSAPTHSPTSCTSSITSASPTTRAGPRATATSRMPTMSASNGRRAVPRRIARRVASAVCDGRMQGLLAYGRDATAGAAGPIGWCNAGPRPLIGRPLRRAGCRRAGDRRDRLLRDRAGLAPPRRGAGAARRGLRALRRQGLRWAEAYPLKDVASAAAMHFGRSRCTARRASRRSARTMTAGACGAVWDR